MRQRVSSIVPGLSHRRPVAPHHLDDLPLAVRLAQGERELERLIARPDLESWRRSHPFECGTLEAVVGDAITSAYGRGPDRDAAHRFLQRTLYRINRMMLFWYDDLRHYDNERSPYLHALRASIEGAWQAWERRQVPMEASDASWVASALRDRTVADIDPPPSASGRYFRDHAPLSAYRRLVAIGALDGLVEASQLSRTLGGVGHPVHGTLTRLLLEEYGGGRLARKHSSYFRTMLEALDLDTTPEAYLDVVPWEVLATINHSFLLSDRRRFFLRYVGGLLYTETAVPAAFRCYLAAARRLELRPDAMTYWELHIKEDARHGPWMLNEVALPLVGLYPGYAWEMILGYDQQRAMGARAGEATARAAATA